MPTKPTKKANRVTFNDDNAAVGVFMTMDEISELVKTVKENTKAEINTTVENKGTSFSLEFPYLCTFYRTVASPSATTTGTSTTIQ